MINSATPCDPKLSSEFNDESSFQFPLSDWRVCQTKLLVALSIYCISENLWWVQKDHTFTEIYRQIISPLASPVHRTIALIEQNNTGEHFCHWTTYPVICGGCRLINFYLIWVLCTHGPPCDEGSTCAILCLHRQQTKTTVHLCWSPPPFPFPTNKDQIDNKHSRWSHCQDLKFHKSPIKLWETLRCSKGALLRIKGNYLKAALLR